MRLSPTEAFDEPLDVARVQAALRTQIIGQRIVYHASLGSTNDLAKELAEAGAAEGTLVIADEQTSGRGRLGRRWLSPPRLNLLLSLIFRPTLSPSQVQRLTMICSLAAADAIRQVAGLEAQIKWPNDILLAGKKAGGILTELGFRGDALAYAIVGLGLNVNLRAEQLPEELRGVATSIAQVAGRPIPREPLLCALLERIEQRYEQLRGGQVPVAEWAARLATLGKAVRVSEGGGTIEGYAEAVDADGALWLRLADGRSQRILAGDVTLREGNGPAS